MFHAAHGTTIEGLILGHDIRITVEVLTPEEGVNANDHHDGEAILVDSSNIKTILLSHLSGALKQLEAVDHGHNGQSIANLRPQAAQPAQPAAGQSVPEGARIIVFPRSQRVN